VELSPKDAERTRKEEAYKELEDRIRKEVRQEIQLEKMTERIQREERKQRVQYFDDEELTRKTQNFRLPTPDVEKNEIAYRDFWVKNVSGNPLRNLDFSVDDGDVKVIYDRNLKQLDEDEALHIRVEFYPSKWRKSDLRADVKVSGQEVKINE